MRRRHVTVVLAMLAALVVAPSSAFAAQPNQLRAASVSPGSGTVATVFTMSVQYVSPAGNPASSVTASVAGISLPLVRVSGSATDGTWRTFTLLPAGGWTVTFRANVSSGPQPTASASVVVCCVATSGPSTTSQPSDSVAEPGAGTGSDGSSQPAPASTATPKPSAQPAPASRSAAPRATTDVAPSAAAVRDGGAGGAHPRPGTRRSGSAAPSSEPEGATTSRATTAATGDHETVPPNGNPDLLWLVLMIGLAGVAAVALLGTGWLLVAGRQERTGEMPEAVPAESDVALRAIPTVEQRAVRRARLRQADDPILAGLGLDELPPQPAAAQDVTHRRRSRAGRAARRDASED
jgi:hypothetical protein